MIVISNTSPLTNLAQIGKLAILQQLYNHIHIATAVWEELTAQPSKWLGTQQIRNATWISRHTVQNKSQVSDLQTYLDRGESETIALALELDTDLVLLDEKIGRYWANHFQLPVMGVIGLLIEAKDKHLVHSIRPELDSLRYEAGFYISQDVYEYALFLTEEE